MSKLPQLLTAACLLAAYAILGYLCIHPDTDEAYSDYFIERTTVYWKAPPTDASLEDGINFNKYALPRFVRGVSGLGRQEAWGRWSVHSRSTDINVYYRQHFEGKSCLTLTAMPSQGQVGRIVLVVFGDSRGSFTTSSGGFRAYSVNLNPKTPTTRLTLIPQRPGPVEWDPALGRTRKTGLALKELSLTNKRCKKPD